MSDRQETLDILRKARGLLSDPVRWGKGMMRNIADDGGECYCVAGAVRKCGGDLRSFDAADVVMRELKISTNFDRVTTFNDHDDTTHVDVLAFLDRATERAESELSHARARAADG